MVVKDYITCKVLGVEMISSWRFVNTTCHKSWTHDFILNR